MQFTHLDDFLQENISLSFFERCIKVISKFPIIEMEDTDPSHPSNTVTRINFTLVFHQILSWILFKITNNKVTSKIRFSINPIQHWVVKLFRMKNTRKIFSYQLFQKKKRKIFIDQHSPTHHTSTALAFLYKKKKKNSLQNFPSQNRAFIAGKNVFQTVFRRVTSNPTSWYPGLHGSLPYTRS